MRDFGKPSGSGQWGTQSTPFCEASMRFCNNCKHMTAGKNLYCQHCGSTFNVKICSRGHINPRAAEVCSQCGSRDLSTPAPKFSLAMRPVVFLLGLGPGVLLLIVLIVYAVYFVFRLLQNPNGLLNLMFLGLLLGLLLLLWVSFHSAARRWTSGDRKTRRR